MYLAGGINVENAMRNDQRATNRPPSRFNSTNDFNEDKLGDTVYVYGGVAGQEEPYTLSGVLNEKSNTGCSIILSQQNASLHVGEEYLLKFNDRGSWAILCWRKEFGSANKLGFRFLN